jgi:hypothetical protein
MYVSDAGCYGVVAMTQEQERERERAIPESRITSRAR